MKHAFREGFHNIGKIDPESAAAELSRIRTIHGALTPAVIVEEAEVESSPIHPHFEWDDTKAAAAHRQQQASQLCRAIIVIEDKKQPYQMLTHVKPVNQPAQYMPSTIVVKEVDLLEDGRNRLLSHLNGIARALRELDTLAGNGPRGKQTKQAIKYVEKARNALGGH